MTQDDIARTLGLDKAPTAHALTRRRWLRLASAVLVVVIAWWAWSHWRGAAPVRYQTQPLARGGLTVTVSATGTLAPTNTVDVGIEVSGTIATVEADYNDRVAVGQVLARLDTTKLKAQVLQTQAALASARARVQQAQASVRESQLRLTRLQRLRETGGYVSEQDVDSAQAALDRNRADAASAAAAVQQTQATLDANRTDLAKAVIRSPIDGVVLERSVEPGQTVAASFQAPVLFTLAEDLAHMELEADIDEADVGTVREGQEASFTVDAYPDRRFPARIEQLRYGAETVEGVVTYKAILEVDNAELALRPGMTATASIVVQQVQDALLLPNAALRFAPAAAAADAPSGGFMSRVMPHPPRSTAPADMASGDSRVWVLQDGAPQPVAVATGSSDGVNTVLVGGPLQEGTAVIVDTAPSS